ncbi:MAG: hypothetical protein JZD40_07075 [Sulfolobus sp.]|nr:hypothetical protein [Sulfolobus sp.]
MTEIVINLWNPQNVNLISAIIIAYLLGIVHGATPDEHTWPITFSYSVGTFSAKGGVKTGLIFSAGFTLQRAILSELAYFALASIFTTATAFGITYIIVGLAMTLAGIYVVKFGKYFHWHAIEGFLAEKAGIHDKSTTEKEHVGEMSPYIDQETLKPVPTNIAFIHGVIAGFGFGAFALIVYFMLAPAMPSAVFGWVPGFLFGLGTMTIQIIFGAFFGSWLKSVKRLTDKGVAFVGKYITRTVLAYGGLVFTIAGSAILVYPQLLNFGITTPIYVHNLHNLGIGFFLVIITVAVLGYVGYKLGVKNAEKLGLVKPIAK